MYFGLRRIISDSPGLLGLLRIICSDHQVVQRIIRINSLSGFFGLLRITLDHPGLIGLIRFTSNYCGLSGLLWVTPYYSGLLGLLRFTWITPDYSPIYSGLFGFTSHFCELLRLIEVRLEMFADD